MGFLLKTVATACAILIASYLFSFIRVEGLESVIVAALLLGLLNAFVRPLLLILTLPINLLTLGLFTLVINGLLLFLVAALVKGFEISGLGSAILAAFIISIISLLLNHLIGSE